MFVIQMLNSADEWELCKWVFDSFEAADNYAKEYFDVFEAYTVEELEEYNNA